MNHQHAIIHVFVMRAYYHLLARSVTDEQVELVDPDALPHDTLHNLRWLVPMAFQYHGSSSDHVRIEG